MKKPLFLGGTFDETKGKYSKLADQIFRGLQLSEFEYLNGGTFNDLEKISGSLEKYDPVFWFPYIPEEKTRITRGLKRKNSFVLTTSKRNLDRKADFEDLIYQSLVNRSNLLVEFTKDHDYYQARVLDPLGNLFLDYSKNMETLGRVLKKRSNELKLYTRLESKQVGEAVIPVGNEDFFSTIRKHADLFHELIHVHPESVNRFLGNVSFRSQDTLHPFRCEKGFPSFKEDDLIFVSERNIDKREINNTSFVAVRNKLPIEYFGNRKPSVDTPIQIRLYHHYKDVRFMLHSHCYVSDVPFTKNLVPCGAIEEADEIISIFPDSNNVNFAINLRGHGSLVLVDHPRHLNELNYKARKMPELQNGYEL